jgi:TusA-related sulfurtransferase
MKRLLTLSVLSLFVLGAPALACGGDKADTQMAKSAIHSEVSNLNNGVQIVLTATQPDVVKAVQKDAEKYLDGMCKSACPFKRDGVEHRVKKIEKGVVITATAQDAEMVEQLRAYAAKKSGDGCCVGCMFGSKAKGMSPCDKTAKGDKA